MSRTAIVILDYNDHQNTRRLVSALSECVLIDRIVVADNSSEPFVLSSGQTSAKADVIRIANNGYAAGNNEAVAYLEKHYGMFDYMIISNPDIEVDGRAIAGCVDFLDNNPRYAVAAPRMFRPDGTPHHLTAWRERSYLCDLAYSAGLLSRTVGMYREAYPPSYFDTAFSQVDCVAGSFFLIRHSVFKQVGYFDPNTFLYYEEDILAARIKRAGYLCAVLNHCRFVHYEGTAVSASVSLLKKYLCMQKSRIYYQKQYRHITALQLAGLYAATALGTAEKSVKTALYYLKKR